MIFDFFNRGKTAKEFMEEAKEKYQVPESNVVPLVAVPKRDQVVYRVGKTEEGMVTLSLGSYQGTMITMSNDGVDQLIRMLEAAKDTADYS